MIKNKPTILVRVDASNLIGSGHVMRCLTLAKELRTRGANVSFICRLLDGNLNDYIRSCSFAVHDLAEVDQSSRSTRQAAAPHSHWLGADWSLDASQTLAAASTVGRSADWLIVDHYALDADWEHAVRHAAERLFVIDDLADRPHACDLLLDQNVHTAIQTRYIGLVGSKTVKLYGLNYLLLRPEFELPPPRRDDGNRSMLVFFGGADAQSLTSTAIEALATSSLTFDVHVLTGQQNQRREHIERRCRQLNFEFVGFQTDVTDLMGKCAFAVSACGFFAYELMACKVRSLLVPQAPIQERVARALEELGVATLIGAHMMGDTKSFALALTALLQLDPHAQGYSILSQSGTRNVVDEMDRMSNG